jgi:hypothetical protein
MCRAEKKQADEGDFLSPRTRLLGWTDKLMHALEIATSFGPAAGVPYIGAVSLPHVPPRFP